MQEYIEIFYNRQRRHSENCSGCLIRDCPILSGHLSMTVT
ncbi:hypothetical protein ACEUAX_21815 [Aeromonas veronii]